jgi:hypothetical protein
MPLLGKSENTKLWPQFKRWIGEMILFISFPLFFPFLSLATWLQHKKGCCTSFRIYLSSWGTSGAGAEKDAMEDLTVSSFAVMFFLSQRVGQDRGALCCVLSQRQVQIAGIWNFLAQRNAGR